MNRNCSVVKVEEGAVRCVLCYVLSAVDDVREEHSLNQNKVEDYLEGSRNNF